MSLPNDVEGPAGSQVRRGGERSDRRCDAITAGVLVSGKDGCIKFANKAASRILGPSQAELSGQPSPCPGWEAVREDGSPLSPAEHPATVALATGKAVHGLVIGLQSPGRTSRWLLVDSEVVCGENTALAEEVVTTFFDITPLKEAQAALHDAEQKFRRLIEAARDWVWEVDENFVYTYTSPRVTEILGYEPEALLGKKPWDFMPPGEAERVAAFAADALRRRSPFEALENTNLHKSGRLVVLETSATPFFDAVGRLCGYRGIDRDIGERKQAHDSLRASETFLRSITDLVPTRIAYVDKEQRYRFVNRRFEEVLGIPREQIIGRHTRDVLGDSVYREIQPYVEAVLSGREVRYELDMAAVTGVRRQLSIVYVPHFGQGGEVLGFYASLDDITERKRLEEQLRQAQKMEAVGVLAGGVAHDFNNLLTVINGYSHLALERLDPEDPVARSIGEVAQAGARAASLTQQLLAFGRKQMLQPKVIDLNALVASIEMMVRRLLVERIELRIDLQPDLAHVKADPAQIEQIIMNLAVNARDAMPGGGTLAIETRDVRLEEADSGGEFVVEPGDYVMLAVSDTGHGMDAATKARVFEPFFTTKGVGKGTGLGLSTTYGIVRQSGGHISIDSEPGRGAKFRICLPAVTDVPRPAEAPGVAPEARAGTETVLLVEDEPALRRMLRDALSPCGYRLLEATDGETALRVAGDHQGAIHLLLTDVVMPRLGGPELAARLMQRRPEMKVLYISGYADTVIEPQGPPDAGSDFLQKPFTADDLARKVGELLAR